MKSSSWLILLSEDALRAFQRQPFLMQGFLKEAKALARGKWSMSRVLSRGPSDIPIFETIISDKNAVIWDVSVTYVHPLTVYMQVIKIRNVILRDDAQSTVDSIVALHRGYSEKYAKACLSMLRGSEPTAPPPLTFDLDSIMCSEEWALHSEGGSRPLGDKEIPTFKRFVPLSRTLIKAINLFGTKGEIPFLLSREEYEVVDKKGSVVLLGRSGTGKTTCLVFRLYNEYRASKSGLTNLWMPYLSKQNNLTEIRQLFVSVSPLLCIRIRDYFLKLKASFRAVSDHAERMSTDTTGRMLEEEDEESLFSSIPNEITVLSDEHFPMFITFRKLMMMLYGSLISILMKQQESDLIAREFLDVTVDDGDIDISSALSKLHFFSQSRKVDYELFERQYWPKMARRVSRKDVHAVLVWAEIMSVIKGSEEAIQHKEGYLSRNHYLNSSQRSFPTFVYNREEIYDMFMRYEYLKAKYYHHVDLMDEVYLIYSLLIRTKAYEKITIHQVYCDEVQDLTVSQIKLLQIVCPNPDGFFLAGDTARTIARGASFSFAQVKAMLFRANKGLLRNNCAQQATKHQLAPESLQLTINYRSHHGILQLASSVVDLIHAYFKGSVDKLRPDSSVLNGPLPIFLEGYKHESLSLGSCGDHDLEEEILEFGAEQVVLVRTQQAKQSVQKNLSAGLVMTIYEAKGLEFNDVLLYNFFTDSPAESKYWCLISPHYQGQEGKTPSVQLEKHSILCSELKHLYTAITRARKQLWIFDSDVEMRKPMLEYWRSLHLITVEGKPLNIAKYSTPQEWKQKGIIFFENRLYRESKLCFTKSKDPELIDLCEANILRQDAKACNDRGDTKEGKDLYYKSAGLFRQLQRDKAAADTFFCGGWFIEAGDIYMNSLKDYVAAARAYHLGKRYVCAGKCLENLENYTGAIEMYAEGNALEVAIYKLTDEYYRNKVDHSLIVRVVKLYCLPILRSLKSEENQRNEKIKNLKMALSLLNSSIHKPEAIFIDYGYINLLDEVFSRENPSEGWLLIDKASLYSERGQKQKAAQLFLEAAQSMLGQVSAGQLQDGFKLHDPNKLINQCLCCLIQFLRRYITSKSGECSAFETPLASFNSNPETQRNYQSILKFAWNMLKECIELYSAMQGIRTEHCVDPSHTDERYSEILNWAILEIRELQAQVMGDIEALQDCLVSCAQIIKDSEASQVRILLILCTARIQERFPSSFDDWVTMQMSLTEIFKKISNLTVSGHESKGIKCYEDFFRVEYIEEKDYYKISEDLVNRPLIELLQRRQDMCGADIIFDVTPLDCNTKAWKCLKPCTLEAMETILAKYIQKTLLDSGEIAIDKNLIQRLCASYANLGACNRRSCKESHSISSKSISAYMTQIAKQAALANEQVRLALRIGKPENKEIVHPAYRLSRYWLEKAQESLHIVSPFMTNSSELRSILKFIIPKDGLKELASRIWLSKEYHNNNYNITTLLQTFYLLVLLGEPQIPIYCRSFVRTTSVHSWNSWNLPVWLLRHKDDLRLPWSMHSNLFNIIKHSRNGNSDDLVRAGYKYVNFLVREGRGLKCYKPLILLWLLEIIVAVWIASFRKFHGIIIPSSLIHTFFSTQTVLCQSIIRTNPIKTITLCELCYLTMEVWRKRLLYPEREEDWFWFAACLRTQIIFAVSSYHMNNEDLEEVWSMMQEVNTIMAKIPIHGAYLPVLHSCTLKDMRANLIEMLKESNDPLVSVLVKERTDISHTLASDIFFEISSSGSIERLDRDLHLAQNSRTSEKLEKGSECSQWNCLLEDSTELKERKNPVTILHEVRKGSCLWKENESKERENPINSVHEVNTEIAAVIKIQSWLRKAGVQKRRLGSRDQIWDSMYDQACLKSKSWRSRYRMLYLGLVLQTLYDLCKLRRTIEKEELTTKREISQPNRSLDDLLQREDTLRTLRELAEKGINALRVENEQHVEGNLRYLGEAYRNAIKTIKEAKKFSLVA
ncbi:hypothetical protein KP509_01G071000 [Ceratopteris richardii]|uniref:UvrD-like helicase C-terminal domain-containing protein n=1 Tax=Ceratopteris richardii TaxID=49495 RepID=A0A8T2VMD3_CERRI|nr:hypothetical protein KP509_01G071000 [Ceratopteris richardii]